MKIRNGKQTYINLEEKEYNKLLDRLDKALVKNESLQDEISELKHSLILKNKTYKIYTQKIKGLRELVDDKKDEIIRLNGVCDSRMLEIEALIGYNKELKKDVEFYRSKVKVLLDDIVQFGRQAYVKSNDKDINLGNKGGKNGSK